MLAKNTSRLFLLSTLMLCMVIAGCEKKSSKTEAKLLVAGNLPLSGPIASFSGQYHMGFQMGVDDESAKLGIPASSFRADFQDNAGDGATAVNVLRQHLLANPQIYVSGTTQMTEPLLPELSKRGIMHFIVCFDAFMTQLNENIYRILPSFKIEAPLFVKYITQKKAKRVFFFTPNLKAYLEESDKLVLPELKKAGIEYQRELFEFKQNDFQPLVEKAAKFKPDVIVISGYAFHVYPILTALREARLTDKAAVISTLDFIDLLHNGTPVDHLKGIAFISPACEIPGKVAAYAPWRDAFKARYGKMPSYVDAYAYDTARIIVAAYAKSGAVTKESLAQVLPFSGIVGDIALDSVRDLESTLTIGVVNSAGVVEEIK